MERAFDRVALASRRWCPSSFALSPISEFSNITRDLPDESNGFSGIADASDRQMTLRATVHGVVFDILVREPWWREVRDPPLSRGTAVVGSVSSFRRHCEARQRRSKPAVFVRRDWIASLALAMTVPEPKPEADSPPRLILAASCR
jgi:hypothetical protein